VATDQPQMAHAMKDANETSLSLPTVVRDPTRPHADTSIVDKKLFYFAVCGRRAYDASTPEVGQVTLRRSSRTGLNLGGRPCGRRMRRTMCPGARLATSRSV